MRTSFVCFLLLISVLVVEAKSISLKKGKIREKLRKAKLKSLSDQHFPELVPVSGRCGNLMVRALDSRYVVQVRAMSGVIELGNRLLSQSVSPPRWLNGYRRIKCFG